MENNNSDDNMTPVNNELPPVPGNNSPVLPEQNPSAQVSPTKKTRHNKTPVVIAIVVATALVIIAAIIIFLRVAQTPPNGDGAYNEAPRVVYSTPENSEDPDADYLSYLEENAKKATTNNESLNYLIDSADFYCMNGDYDKALEVLDGLSLDKYSDPVDLYKIYQAYALIYSEDFLNESNLYEQYNLLAEEQLQLYTNL